jgi:hypothetical protein
MKAVFSKVLVGFSILFLFSSCTKLLYTSIDVLKPAKVTFDPQKNNLLIVNNTVEQPDDYGHKNAYLGEKAKNLTQKTDSLPLFCLSVLNDGISNTGFFNDVNLEFESVNNSADFFNVQVLSTDNITRLSKKYNANVILSLDRLKVNDQVREYYSKDYSTYYVTLDARLESQWSLHYPGNSQYGSIIFRDTLFWDGESSFRQRALSQLPDRAAALFDAAVYVGNNMVKRLIPQWEKADRYFFENSNKSMKQGYDSLVYKNWEAAISIWDEALPTSKVRIQALLAHNIAVTYEILGDIDNAISYAQKSLEYFELSQILNYRYYELAERYLIILQIRKNELNMIDKQLGV